MGSWAFHYASWKTGLIKIPRILIRYEDLLDDVNKEFNYLIKFLSKILKFTPDNNQLKFSIKNSEFVTLSKYEKKFGFSESNLSNKLFFNKGKKQQWQSKLNTSQLKKIEKSFHKEMIELGYINNLFLNSFSPTIMANSDLLVFAVASDFFKLYR